MNKETGIVICPPHRRLLAFNFGAPGVLRGFRGFRGKDRTRVAARAGSMLLLAGAATLPGCIKRTISITSEPSGALVWLNDVEVGRTPLETDFTHFGKYDVRLRLPGYEPLNTTREARAPLYEVPPADAVAEAIPGTQSSRIDWFFPLTPTPEAQAIAAKDQAAREAAEQDLIGRAQTLRNQVGGATLPPPGGRKTEKPIAD